MLNRALVFVIALTVLFTCLIGGTRVIPYDSRRIPALIDAPEARGICTAPICWLNIAIGSTGWTRVYENLATHEWVARYSPDPDFGTGEVSTGAFSVAWANTHPAWVNGLRPITYWSERGVIVYTRFYSQLTLGDLWLTYGAPDISRIVGRGDVRQSVLLYAALWRDHGLAGSIFITCPARLAWDQPVTIWRYDTAVEEQVFGGVDVRAPSALGSFCV